MPIDLVANIFEMQGALVEDDASTPSEKQILLPEHLQTQFDLPEIVRLGTSDHPGVIGCGYGSQLLSEAVGAFLEHPRLAVVHADVPEPTTDVPQRYTGLNVALRPAPPVAKMGWVLYGDFLADATADDRRQSRISTAISLPDGAPLAPIDLAGLPLTDTDERPDAHILKTAQIALERAAWAATERALGSFRLAVARRHRRDAVRVHRYFHQMRADLKHRMKQRRGAKGLKAKLEGLPAERERRLGVLRDNYTIRTQLKPLSLVLIRSPIAQSNVEILRRKKRRKIEVSYHPFLKAWQPVACESCGAGSYSIGACDAEVHILCETCLEEKGKKCPRCRRRPPAALKEQRSISAQYETVTL